VKAKIIVTLLVALLPFGSAKAGIVINEVFYNAPNDMDDLQWIELYNPDDLPSDVGNWTVDKGKTFTFPAGTRIAPKGYLVVALSPETFSKAYGTTAMGPLKRPLKRNGGRLELRDGRDKLVDVAEYKNRSPWPVSADGYSASLERICPATAGDMPEPRPGIIPPAA
jgi:hypothetical protein